MQTSRRVVHVIHSGAVGGGPEVVLALARGAPGHHVVAAPDDGPLLHTARACGIETLTLPFTGKYTFPISAPPLLRAFRSASIVHVHGQYAAFYAAPLARITATPVLYTAHFPSFVTDTNRRTVIRNHLVERLSCLASSQAVSCCESMRQEFISRRLTSPNHIITIYNGVSKKFPRDDLDKLREELRVNSRDFVVLALGRFTEQKGFDVLLSALPAMTARLPNVKLLLVGDGYARNDLESQAQRTGVEESVRFTGFRNDTRDLLELADIVAVPSRYDIFPLVPLEAMMAAKTVVATDLPVLREAIDDGVTGVLTRLDPGSIARTIVQLLQDPRRRSAMGEAARTRAEALFTTDLMVRRYTQAYETIERCKP